MALVLVQSCCKPCEWGCKACNACADSCTKCVNETCRACGSVCDGCCKWCGNTCNKCCGCCSQGCDGVMKWIDQYFAKPYAGCVLFTVVINLITALACIYYLAKFFTNTCPKPLHIWVLVALFVFVVNTAFGFYVFSKLSNAKPRGDPNNPEGHAAGFKDQAKQAQHFFLYDPVVALYILCFVFSIVWGIVGLVWEGQSHNGTCAFELLRMTRGGAIVLLVFVGLAFTCIFCGLLSGWCNEALEDCNFFKCLCCCCYFLCCYEEEQRQKERRAKKKGDQAEQQPLGQNGRPVSAAPAIVVAQPVHSPHQVSPTAPPPYPQPTQQQYQQYTPQAAQVASPVYQQQHAQQQPHQQPYQQPYQPAYSPAAAQQPYQQPYQQQYVQAQPYQQPYQQAYQPAR